MAVGPAGGWGCAAAEGSVVEAAFPSGVVMQGAHDFGIVSRCRQPGLSGRAGDVLLAQLLCSRQMVLGSWSVPR